MGSNTMAGRLPLVCQIVFLFLSLRLTIPRMTVVVLMFFLPSCLVFLSLYLLQLYE